MLTNFTIENVQQCVQHHIGTIKVLNIDINPIKFGLKGSEFLTKTFEPRQSTASVETTEFIEEEYEACEEFDEVFDVVEEVV